VGYLGIVVVGEGENPLVRVAYVFSGLVFVGWVVLF
jgi:hypothetical protein